MLLPAPACLYTPSTGPVKVPSMILTASSARGRPYLAGIAIAPCCHQKIPWNALPEPCQRWFFDRRFQPSGWHLLTWLLHLSKSGKPSASFSSFPTLSNFSLTCHRCALTRWYGWCGTASSISAASCSGCSLPPPMRGCSAKAVPAAVLAICPGEFSDFVAGHHAA